MSGRLSRALAIAGAAMVAAACGQGQSGGVDAADSQAETRRRAEASPSIRVVDDSGRELELSGPSRRIVSLVPSVTETIAALGAADRLVARTRYDLDPALAHLPSLGGGPSWLYLRPYRLPRGGESIESRGNQRRCRGT